MNPFFSTRKIQVGIEDWYGGDQALGRTIGSIDIQCTLRANSKWTTQPLSKGILYLGINYIESEGIPIRSAKVKIDVGPETNGNPVPTFEDHAPLQGLTAEAFVQHVTNTRDIAPRLEVSVPGGPAVNVGGIGVAHNTEYNEELRWSFAAGRGSSGNGDSRPTQANFTWSCESERCQWGIRRPFEGALLLQRAEAKSLVLRVSVEATPFKSWHRLGLWNKRVQRSKPIGPGPLTASHLQPAEFEALCNNLQDEILEMNMRLALRELPMVNRPVQTPV